jgi:hypothetical protein
MPVDAPLEPLSSLEREKHASHRHAPPAVPHRRYPSLCDDGQPRFPRAPWSRDTSSESPAARPSGESDLSRFPNVRAIALIGIAAIITAVVANA